MGELGHHRMETFIGWSHVTTLDLIRTELEYRIQVEAEYGNIRIIWLVFFFSQEKDKFSGFVMDTCCLLCV